MKDNKIGVYHYRSCNSFSLTSLLKRISIPHELSDDFEKLTNYDQNKSQNCGVDFQKLIDKREVLLAVRATR